MNKKQYGFGVVEIILIVAILGVLGFVGWQVWHAQTSKVDNNVASDTPAPAASTTESTANPDQYADWKTYTLQYEKFSFKYPSDFTLNDESGPDEYVSTNGTDRIELTKSNGFLVDIRTGLHDIGGACESCMVAYSQDVTFLGQNLRLNFVDNLGDGKIGYVTVGADDTDWFGASVNGKNIKNTYDNQVTPISVAIRYKDGESYIGKTLDEFKKSTDLAEAVKILESASY